MLHDNNTPLAALGFEQWHPNGATMAVVVARARIRVDGDGSQYLTEGVKLVLADGFAGDPHKTPMLRCNDLIPFKPGADVTVLCDLQAADPGRPLVGKLAIGGAQAQVFGCGPRQWFYDRVWRLSDPAPVDRVPVCYTLARGGRHIGDPDGNVDPHNPIGAGVIHPEFTPKTRSYPAPQLATAPISSDPAHLAGAALAGLGPMPPWWRDRQRFAGTYDAEWLETTHPRLPTDFDYRHYQVANPLLRLKTYLHPGATLRTTGLRPEGAAFDLALPDLVPIATFSFADGRQVQAQLHLDGLHLDLRADVPTYDLTWRAWIETCPAFHRIDLDLVRSAQANALGLPVSGPDGLVAAYVVFPAPTT